MQNKTILCPLCESQSEHLFNKNGYAIYLCKECDYEFILVKDTKSHVSSTYGNDYFEAGNSGYRNYLDNAKLLTRAGEKYSKLISRYTSPGKILDVGSAAGFLLKGFIDRGWTGNGIEPNASMVQYANNSLNLNIRQGTIEEYESNEEYDLILMSQVISHFLNIEKAFSVAANHTKKNGFWLIETWNKNSITAKIFGNKWHEYNPPSVLRWFSRDSLKEYLRKFGFELVLAKHSVKWINAKQAKNIISYNLDKKFMFKILSGSINFIPDNYRIPYLGNDLFFALFQKIR